VRRLPGVLLTACAALIVIVALSISGLRIVLPQINTFQKPLIDKVQSITGIPVALEQIQGSWQTFGPQIQIDGLQVTLPDASWHVEHLTLALDVWQSLLHWRWQFRDLTFYHSSFTLETPLWGQEKHAQSQPLQSNIFSDIFFRQIDHFTLKESELTLTTPSGARVKLAMPQLVWFNSGERHRAEGQINFSSFNSQHGLVQLRMDLNDQNGLLNDGKIYLQADNIDMKPWFSRWLRNNTGLESADFSLATWLTLRGGDLKSVDTFVKNGTARWRVADQLHQLDANGLAIHSQREGNNWYLSIPELDLKTDNQPWPQGALSAWYLQPDDAAKNELRVRANKLLLERVTPLLPMLSFIAPELANYCQALQPQGSIDSLALDIPLHQPEESRFDVSWRDISWQQWKLWPGISHFSGQLRGSVADGQLDLHLKDSTLPYQGMFRAPLEVREAQGSIDWQHNAQGWLFQANDLDVKTKDLWINGGFDYQQPPEGKPWLSILAGIRLYDAGQSWRYFPEPLMRTPVVDYLSPAIQAGQVDNATLTFNGDPADFPFREHQGQFEVWVPLRHATYQFQPTWPAITNLDIDLDFVNSGLFMQAPSVQLGQVTATHLQADIPEYMDEKLLIDGALDGQGKDIASYFMNTPLQGSLGNTLQQLEIGGDVSGHLHLDIPFHGQQVTATGDVTLKNNALQIKPLSQHLEQVNGQFSFNNGNLTSNTLSASWLGQPVSFTFNTNQQTADYQVQVALNGNWQANKLALLPANVASSLSGNTAWNSTINVSLPYKGAAKYKVDIGLDLKEMSSQLPAPLAKPVGKALPVTLSAQGDEHSFTLSGALAGRNRFNSLWILGKQLRLDRASWQPESNQTPSLPDDSSLAMRLPALDASHWLALLAAQKTGDNTLQSAAHNVALPQQLTLDTPELVLAGQLWHDVSLRSVQSQQGMQVSVKGKEIDGALVIPDNGTWQANIHHLYYNPQWKTAQETTQPPANSEAEAASDSTTGTFNGWPSLNVNCEDCWFFGQSFRRLAGQLEPSAQQLSLRHGLIDTGVSRLDIEGSWTKAPSRQTTQLTAKLAGKDFEQAASFLGMPTPLKGGPFTLGFDLSWQDAPWKPDAKTLNGVMKTDLGKGEIVDMGGGRAGQLLRLVSFDALLRKLRLDFSDTFGKSFYFDSIKSTALIKQGVIHTDDLLIDGLAADIAMNGSVDLVNQQINMMAVITPKISATVGVATAFAVNPIVGAAVFAASQVLSPLWHKISLIRYQIDGSIEQPKIHEVLRETKDVQQPKAASH
jgi:uncharacterized protein (TIGR02099 family)